MSRTTFRMSHNSAQESIFQLPEREKQTHIPMLYIRVTQSMQRIFHDTYYNHSTVPYVMHPSPSRTIRAKREEWEILLSLQMLSPIHSNSWKCFKKYALCPCHLPAWITGRAFEKNLHQLQSNPSVHAKSTHIPHLLFFF